MVYKKIFGETPLDITSFIEDGNVNLYLINLNNLKFISIKLLETHHKNNIQKYNCLIYPFLEQYQSIDEAIDSMKLSGYIPNYFTKNLLLAIHDCMTLPLWIKSSYKTEKQAAVASKQKRGDLYYKDLYNYANYIYKSLIELGLKKSEINNILKNKTFI